MQHVVEKLQEILSQEHSHATLNSFETISYQQEISFVDGGSAPIIISPTLGLYFCRIARVMYQSLQKISTKIITFFVLVEKNETVQVKIFDYPHAPKIDVDATITIEQAANIARRIIEIHFQHSALAVIDGSLQCTHKHETMLLQNLPRAMGVMKTSEKTMQGLVPGLVIPQKRGYCLLSKSNHFATYACRFHKKSKYIFLVDTTDQKWLSVLVQYSKDPVFIGYPYPLLLVDQLARISTIEQEQVRLQILHKIKNQHSFISHINAQNAHDVLDNISY